MTPQKIIEFIKINGGAATALLLSFMYINKLETRLEKVESQLHDCYTRNYAVSDFNNYTMPIPTQIIAILPKETKICKDGKRKIKEIA
jgi:hypothetical protein